MKTKKFQYYPLLLLLIFLNACDFHAEERAKLNEELNSVTDEMSTLSSSISYKERQLETSRQTIQDKRNELRQTDAYEDNYMGNHKMAVVAIVAGVKGTEVALDVKDEYDKNEEEFGGIAAVIALGWAVFHMDEVNEVISTIDDYEQKKKQLQADINDATISTNSLENDIATDKAQLSILDNKSASIRNQLQEL